MISLGQRRELDELIRVAALTDGHGASTSEIMRAQQRLQEAVPELLSAIDEHVDYEVGLRDDVTLAQGAEKDAKDVAEHFRTGLQGLLDAVTLGRPPNGHHTIDGLLAWLRDQIEAALRTPS